MAGRGGRPRRASTRRSSRSRRTRPWSTIPAPATGTLVRQGARRGRDAAGRRRARRARDRSRRTRGAGGPAAQPPIDARRRAPSRRRRTRPPTRSPAAARGARDARGSRASPASTCARSRAAGRTGGSCARTSSAAASAGAAAARPAPRRPRRAPGEVVPLRGMRRAIARALTKAWRTVPHITDYREVDATALLEAAPRCASRRAARRRGAGRRAHADAAARQDRRRRARRPPVRQRLDRPRARGDHAARAARTSASPTASRDGLVVPVVHDADQRSIDEIAREIARLTAPRAGEPPAPRGPRRRHVHGQQLRRRSASGSARRSCKPPEVANLGVGADPRPGRRASTAQPVVRPTLALAVSGDHRVLDGHTLAAFVTDVVRADRAARRCCSGACADGRRRARRAGGPRRHRRRPGRLHGRAARRRSSAAR